MKMAFLLRIILICACALSMGSVACFADSFADGIAAFQRKDYDTAAEEFHKVEKAKPGNARILLWEGLALYGSEGLRPAMDAWNKLSANAYDDWGMTANLFKAYAYWTEGNRSQAAFFLDPTVKRRGYEAVKKAAKQLNAGADAPELSQWIVGTPLEPAPAKKQTAQNAPKPNPTKKQENKPKPAGTQKEKPEQAKTANKNGSATQPPFGHFKVGDHVLVRTAGKIWEQGVITKVPQEKDLVGNYLIKTSAGLEYYHWYTNVAGTQREPYWTQFFVGTWEVHIPMASNTVTDGNSVYRTYSGRAKLPPLYIYANGTYAWAQSGKKGIHGRWKARPDAPGIILLKGENGADWTLYNTSDASTKKQFNRDEIELDTEKYTYKKAYRIK